MTDIKPEVLLRITLLLSIATLAQGCADQRNQPDCADVFESRLEKSNFKIYKNKKYAYGSYNYLLSSSIIPSSGLTVGNAITSRICFTLVKNITKRSIPIPHPAVGGKP